MSSTSKFHLLFSTFIINHIFKFKLLTSLNFEEKDVLRKFSFNHNPKCSKKNLQDVEKLHDVISSLKQLMRSYICALLGKATTEFPISSLI